MTWEHNQELQGACVGVWGAVFCLFMVGGMSQGVCAFVFTRV